MTTLAAVLAELRSLDEPVPSPPRLPTASEVAAMEQAIGIPFHADYRRYLLEASDVTLGTLEPATICEPSSHTHLLDIVASARALGVPPELLPICEDNADFYCLDAGGAVHFWSHNGASEESWPDFASWLRNVWIEGNA